VEAVSALFSTDVFQTYVIIFSSSVENYCLLNFLQSNVTAVEIDCAMLSVAQTYFGLTLSERLKVEIQDGLQFIKNSSSTG
jgi:spermidine synthase